MGPQTAPIDHAGSERHPTGLQRPLDPRTLDAVAELICGDGYAWYRKGWQLPGFFSGAGIATPDHDGSGRKRWTLDQLLALAADLQAQERVLLRIADPREYRDPELTLEATNALNGVLAVEGLRVQRIGAASELVHVDPALLPSSDPSPILTVDLGRFTNDPLLRELLQDRWHQAGRCLEAGAYLASVVMLGGLLEGVLLAVAMDRLERVHRASSAPKNRATGKPLRFDDWRLVDLINVAHECGWIEYDVKQFSHSLREYRNVVHPHRQLSLRARPDRDTCQICWRVVTAALNDLARIL
jgi:hypothetical protein